MSPEETNNGPVSGPVSVMPKLLEAPGTLAPGSIVIIYHS
jgi:hypothetical protein